MCVIRPPQTGLQIPTGVLSWLQPADHLQLTPPTQCGCPITSRFDPVKPADICLALSSLDRYCGKADTQCKCYSSTYYVPQMWSSLAAGCARLKTHSHHDGEHAQTLCSIGQEVASHINDCRRKPTDHVTSASFGQYTKIHITTATLQTGEMAEPTDTASPAQRRSFHTAADEVDR
jgi:hypothetical protein